MTTAWYMQLRQQHVAPHLHRITASIQGIQAYPHTVKAMSVGSTPLVCYQQVRHMSYWLIVHGPQRDFLNNLEVDTPYALR